MKDHVPYNPSVIEPKWQKRWKESKIYEVDLDSKNDKNFFSLTMFPYPSGDLHIGLLKKHGCKFWDHWADEDGFVPSAYGNFWRKFPVHGKDEYNDQVKYVLDTLKKNPNSRRMVISAWAPGNAQDSGLPPVSYTHLTLPTNREV